jgi:predicted dinucleotide-utilizing enzyme
VTARRGPCRIGILGAGFIATELYRHLCAGTDPGLAPAFVWARRPEALAGVAPGHRLADLAGAAARAPDLVVEAAHPDLTRRHGAALLAVADYMPLSVSALTDDALAAELVAAAQAAGTRLFLPVGALVGGQALVARRGAWDRVTITFRKHPDNIDFALSGIDPATITAETVVFDGAVRDIGRLFPRNVNTMVTCGLASVGLDRCRGRLIADPALTVAVAEVEAVGHDGSTLRTQKRQPVVGVSGTEMFASLLRSIRLATGQHMGMEIV